LSLRLSFDFFVNFFRRPTLVSFFFFPPLQVVGGGSSNPFSMRFRASSLDFELPALPSPFLQNFLPPFLCYISFFWSRRTLPQAFLLLAMHPFFFDVFIFFSLYTTLGFPLDFLIRFLSVPLVLRSGFSSPLHHMAWTHPALSFEWCTGPASQRNNGSDPLFIPTFFCSPQLSAPRFLPPDRGQVSGSLRIEFRGFLRMASARPIAKPCALSFPPCILLH